MVYNFLYEKLQEVLIEKKLLTKEELAKELYKPNIRKF